MRKCVLILCRHGYAGSAGSVVRIYEQEAI